MSVLLCVGRFGARGAKPLDYYVGSPNFISEPPNAALISRLRGQAVHDTSWDIIRAPNAAPPLITPGNGANGKSSAC